MKKCDVTFMFPNGVTMTIRMDTSDGHRADEEIEKAAEQFAQHTGTSFLYKEEVPT